MHRVCLRGAGVLAGGDFLRTARAYESSDWLFCSLALCLAQHGLRRNESYLVDPASSHMLVSKIKPCMSKFTLFHGETANGSLNQSRFLR